MPKSLAYGVAQWSNWPSISSVSGPDALPQHGAPAHAVLRRGDRRPRRRRRCRASRAACVLMITPRVPGDVVGDLLHQLHADVGAPRVLHAARGEQPERIVLRPCRRPSPAPRPTARRSPSTSAAPGTRAAACPTSACRARAAAGRARCRCAAAAPGRAARSAGPLRTSVGYRYHLVRGNGLVAKPCSFNQSRPCDSRPSVSSALAARQTASQIASGACADVGRERDSPSAAP